MIAFRARNRTGGPSLLARCSVLLWVATFLLPGVRDAFAHVDCAHHAAYAASLAAEHEGHAGTAEPAHAAGHGAHTGDAADPDAPHPPCTCVGPCQAAGAIALPAPPLAALEVPFAPQRPVAVLPQAERLPSRPPYILPYAIAPPRA